MKGLSFKSYWVLMMLILFSATFSYAAEAPHTGPGSIAPMLKKILPAVVNLTVQVKPQPFAPSRPGQKNDSDASRSLISIGSGVIVDAKNGYILTNVHVLEDAQTITVTLYDGRHYTAKIIGVDKPSDVALVQIKAKNLTAVTLGDSTRLEVGDKVAVIGNPFGQLTQSVTSGIVSALGRATLGIEGYENFIQTDAPINPGNSGGALVNMDGELIGINTAIVSPQQGTGIGFAIPSNMAKTVMQQLIQYGNVRRGALGVGAQDITPQLASAFDLNLSKGAVITQVMPSSPAERAGLQVGDVVSSINGTDIKNANDVVNAIAFLRVDSKANLIIIRNGKSIPFTTAITDPQKSRDLEKAKDPFLFGATLKDFTVTNPIHRDVSGVLVIGVDLDSNAWHADLRPGDIIVSANKIPVSTINDLRKISSKAKETLLLNIVRGPAAIFLVINREEI